MKIAWTTKAYCPNRYSGHTWCHRCTDDEPKARRLCGSCGARLQTWEGTWAVVPWRGDGRYSVADALATFASRVRADDYAERAGESYVTRWLLRTDT